MQKLYITAFFTLLFSFDCWAGVASNPFLRPGSNRPPPQVAPPPPPPKPVANPSVAQEVEFRGYFLLKGIPHFCIFNKKANFGEWIKLTEKTYEEFEAQAFDLDTETLTVAFSGQNFELRLQERQGSSATPQSSNSLPKISLPPANSTYSATGKKVMPPRPTSIPSMPEWLSNRISSRSTATGRTGGINPSSSSSFSGSRSARFAPIARNSMSAGNGLFDSSNNISSIDQSPVVPSTSTNNVSNTNSSPSNTFAGSSQDAPSTSFSDQINNSVDNPSQDSVQSELDDLPPPPPPPNIFPPSPPPDIVPTMNE